MMLIDAGTDFGRLPNSRRQQVLSGKRGSTDILAAFHRDAGASGSVTLLGGGKKTLMKLVPAGGNVLKATAAYPSTPDIKAVVSVRMADKSEAAARFEPIAAEVPGQAGRVPVVDPHAGHH